MSRTEARRFIKSSFAFFSIFLEIKVYDKLSQRLPESFSSLVQAFTESFLVGKTLKSSTFFILASKIPFRLDSPRESIPLFYISILNVISSSNLTVRVMLTTNPAFETQSNDPSRNLER